MKRIEGQLRGVLKIMHYGNDFKYIVVQLLVERSAVDRMIGVVVSENLVECVRNVEGIEGKVDEMIKEAVNLVVKSR